MESSVTFSVSFFFFFLALAFSFAAFFAAFLDRSFSFLAWARVTRLLGAGAVGLFLGGGWLKTGKC